MPREDFGDDSPGDVGRAARGERHDHRDGARRIVLGLCAECGCQKKRKREREPLHCHFLS